MHALSGLDLVISELFGSFSFLVINGNGRDIVVGVEEISPQ